MRPLDQHFDAIVKVDDIVKRIRLSKAKTMYDARLKARSLDLAPVAIEQVVEGRIVARIDSR